MQIDIDEHSGFCFGVTNAIRQAEEGLQRGPLYCLGDIVHNGEEVERLSRLGLETIDYDDLRTLHNVPVLFRAHGEPPSTYRIAERNGIRVTDATCPVVLKLQERIRKCYEEHREAQIVIYGQRGHAEVIGLLGQTNNTAIVIEHIEEADTLLDYTRDIYLFSQTTKSVEGFRALENYIRERISSLEGRAGGVSVYDTICRNVANRVDNIRRFAREHDLVIFVGGKKSSNAKVLYQHCLEANPKTIFISSVEELKVEKLKVVEKVDELKVGICGATSTPQWLMEQVRDYLQGNEMVERLKS